jgi:hypothetical protein
VLQVLPQTFIGPTAGVVNDRISRKRVMIAADLIRAVIVLSMLLVRSREMVWLVYPLLLLETIMAAFSNRLAVPVIPNITSREDVIVANTLGSITWSMNLVLGATGGAAALLGRDAVFVLNALSFLLSALFITGTFCRAACWGGRSCGARVIRLHACAGWSAPYRSQRGLLATVFLGGQSGDPVPAGCCLPSWGKGITRCAGTTWIPSAARCWA